MGVRTATRTGQLRGVADLLRLGVVAVPDPDPEREVAAWREDLERGAIDDPAETRERLAALDRGEYALAELHCSAELVDDGALTKHGDTVVSGCWLSRSEGTANMRHVAELVKDHLDDLHDQLAAGGLEVDLRHLASLPIHVELDDTLSATLDQSATA